MVGTQILETRDIECDIFILKKTFDIISVAQPLRKCHPKRFFLDQGCLKSLDVPSMVTSKALRGRLTHLFNVTFLNKWQNNNFLRWMYHFNSFDSHTMLLK